MEGIEARTMRIAAREEERENREEKRGESKERRVWMNEEKKDNRQQRAGRK
jgi:hypothetical protein